MDRQLMIDNGSKIRLQQIKLSCSFDAAYIINKPNAARLLDWQFAVARCYVVAALAADQSARFRALPGMRKNGRKTASCASNLLAVPLRPCKTTSTTRTTPTTHTNNNKQQRSFQF